MKQQRGFFIYVLGMAGIAIALLSTLLWLQSGRLERAQAALEREREHHRTTKSRYDAFSLDVKQRGLAAQKRADAKREQDQLAKEKTDAETKRLRADLTTATRQLRDAGARARADSGRSILPAITTSPGRPDRITFDRAELDNALREYLGTRGSLLEETSGLIIEGEKGRVELNAARKWAKEE